jgi:hypothetical protein
MFLLSSLAFPEVSLHSKKPYSEYSFINNSKSEHALGPTILQVSKYVCGGPTTQGGCKPIQWSKINDSRKKLTPQNLRKNT